MSRFTYYRKNNPCPICGQGNGNCRQKEDLTFCMTVTEATEIAGWSFLGKTKDLLWGKWVVDNRQAWNQQQRDEWRREQEQKKQQRLEAEAKRNAEAMAAEERDKHYRNLLSQLGLSQADRSEIEKRFTKAGIPQSEWDSLIQKWGVKSVSKWQPLTEELPHTLPGISINGQSLITPASGYLCPVLDVDGEIVACQVRYNDEETRYTWLSQGATQKRPNPPTLKVNGEIPVAVFRPDQVKGNGIALVEGVGAKPFIACYKLGVATIGAAGGQFASSPKTVQATLERLATEYNTRTVVFCTDAGAIANKNVMRQYQPAWELLQSWGYEVEIPWWGQTDKHQHNDIDELDTLDGVETISIEQFEQLAIQAGGLVKVEKGKGSANPVILQIKSKGKHGKQINRQEWQRKKERRELLRQIEKLYGKHTRKYHQKFGELPVGVEAKERFGQKAEDPKLTPENGSAIVSYNHNQNGWWKLEVTPENLPTPEEWAEKGRPKLIYKPNDRRAIFDGLIKLGFPYILVTDMVGAGKSHDTGEFLLERGQSNNEDPTVRYFYLADDYRNPSTSSLETIPEAVSGAGLVVNYDQLTPNGNPYRRRVQEGEIPDIAPPCIEDTNIQLARGKGFTVGRGSDSPLCKICQFSGNCSYLQEQEAQKTAPVLRSNLNKLSTQEGERTIVFVEEAGRSIKGKQELKAHADSITRELQEIFVKDPELYQRVLPIATVIQQGVNRAIAEAGKYPHLHDQVLKYLPSKEQLEALLFEAYYPTWVNIDNPFKVPSIYELAGRIGKLLSPKLEKEFEKYDTQERGKYIEFGLTVGLLPRLMKIIIGRHGDISISQSRTDKKGRRIEEIILTYRNYQHANSLAKTEAAILLDATPDLIDLAKKLNIHTNQIVQIEAERPTFPNLTLRFFRGLGTPGSQREHYKDGKLVESKYSQQRRVENVVEAIVQSRPNQKIGILDRKSYIGRYQELEGLQGAPLVTGYHFHDNRGSNRFMDCTTMISVGRAVENLGAAIAEWHVMTGEVIESVEAARNSDKYKAFRAWFSKKIVNEAIQDAGRDRAQHRPNVQIEHNFLSEYTESEKQAIIDYFPGCKVEEVDVYDVCPQAAPKGVQTERVFLEAMWNLTVAGEELKIDKVAEPVGVHKSRVSQLSKTVHSGGFRGLRQSLIRLLEALNSRTKLSDLTPEDWWFAKTYLPEIANEISPDRPESGRGVLEDFVSIWEAVGTAKFRQILAATPVDTLSKLISGFLRLTPSWFQSELVKARERCLQEIAVT